MRWGTPRAMRTHFFNFIHPSPEIINCRPLSEHHALGLHKKVETIFDGAPLTMLTHHVTFSPEWIIDEYSDTYHIKTHPRYKNAQTSDR